MSPLIHTLTAKELPFEHTFTFCQAWEAVFESTGTEPCVGCLEVRNSADLAQEHKKQSTSLTWKTCSDLQQSWVLRIIKQWQRGTREKPKRESARQKRVSKRQTFKARPLWGHASRVPRSSLTVCGETDRSLVSSCRCFIPVLTWLGSNPPRKHDNPVWASVGVNRWDAKWKARAGGVTIRKAGAV